MKDTGIIRRVDELGRVVIPTDIRRTLDIPCDSNVEVYVDGDMVCFRKYDADMEWQKRVDNLCASLDKSDLSDSKKVGIRRLLEKAKALITE
mgnify:CR=1 FL=1